MSTFEPDNELAAQLARQADSLVSDAMEQGRNLDYSDASIEALEGFVDRMWVVGQGMFEGEGLARFQWNLAVAAAAYLGETLRRNHGGAWGWSAKPDGSRAVGFQDARGLVVAHPVAKVRKRLENGPVDDLRSFYEFTAHWERVQTAKAARAEEIAQTDS